MDAWLLTLRVIPSFLYSQYYLSPTSQSLEYDKPFQCNIQGSV